MRPNSGEEKNETYLRDVVRHLSLCVGRTLVKYIRDVPEKEGLALNRMSLPVMPAKLLKLRDHKLSLESP